MNADDLREIANVLQDAANHTANADTVGLLRNISNAFRRAADDKAKHAETRARG